VPTRNDYLNEAKTLNAPYPDFWQRCGRDHPFINCSTSLDNALNMWHVPPGPDWWQHRMCLDVAHPAGVKGATPEVSLRWVLYHAAVEGAPHGLSLTFTPPPVTPNRLSSTSPMVLPKLNRVLPDAMASRVISSHHRRTHGFLNGFACTSKPPTRLSSLRRRSRSCV